MQGAVIELDSGGDSDGDDVPMSSLARMSFLADAGSSRGGRGSWSSAAVSKLRRDADGDVCMRRASSASASARAAAAAAAEAAVTTDDGDSDDDDDDDDGDDDGSGDYVPSDEEDVKRNKRKQAKRVQSSDSEGERKLRRRGLKQSKIQVRREISRRGAKRKLGPRSALGAPPKKARDRRTFLKDVDPTSDRVSRPRDDDELSLNLSSDSDSDDDSDDDVVLPKKKGRKRKTGQVTLQDLLNIDKRKRPRRSRGNKVPVLYDMLRPVKGAEDNYEELHKLSFSDREESEEELISRRRHSSPDCCSGEDEPDRLGELPPPQPRLRVWLCWHCHFLNAQSAVACAACKSERQDRVPFVPAAASEDEDEDEDMGDNDASGDDADEGDHSDTILLTSSNKRKSPPPSSPIVDDDDDKDDILSPRRHKRLRSLANSKLCPICKQPFRDEEAVRQHFEAEHDDTSPPSPSPPAPSDPPVKCPVCNEEYPAAEIARHASDCGS